MYSVKADKSVGDWVVAIYCDYGKESHKAVIRLSYSLESGKNSWKKFKKPFSMNGWRCWQEDRKANIINDTKNEIIKK